MGLGSFLSLALQGNDLVFRIDQQLAVFRIIQEPKCLFMNPYPGFLQIQG